MTYTQNEPSPRAGPANLAESAKRALAQGMPMDHVSAIALASIADDLHAIREHLERRP